MYSPATVLAENDRIVIERERIKNLRGLSQTVGIETFFAESWKRTQAFVTLAEGGLT
jgi:hypothetical protein